MEQKHIYIFLAVVIVASLLQFISIGFLGNSIASNTPVLGELLTFIDYLYFTNYLKNGLDMSNMVPFGLRAVSLVATAYTVIILYDIGFYKLNELFNDSKEFAPIIKGITIIAAIVIHYFIYYFLHTIFIGILFPLYHKIEEINKMIPTIGV
ncbi:hypothetical protein [Paenibacillus sp. IHBB 10380]|uniref:hypothetical protein n=1 Tax=Paenibacillus sp. IHBB 10380 TaxID=1566358 RepID=UPI0005CFAABC|nr:hypothetical protein [Paenibacillus sp. IHBB 10380]AJS59996.1 hypothetical protein UB51_17685 [Paenibacillus sp. IHBB 10380]